VVWRLCRAAPTGACLLPPQPKKHPNKPITHAFREAFMILDRGINLLLNLPLAGLDTLALKREVDRIGKQ
jgi:hypothetical protein